MNSWLNEALTDPLYTTGWVVEEYVAWLRRYRQAQSHLRVAQDDNSLALFNARIGDRTIYDAILKLYESDPIGHAALRMF